MELEDKPLSYDKDVAMSLTRFGRYVYNAFFFGGYIGAIIAGEFGKGKSTTAMHLGREIAQAVYGLNEYQGYEVALDNMVFTMDEIINATDNLGTVQDWEDIDPLAAIKQSAKLRKPFIIWDDAAMHGSKYKHFLDMNMAYELQSNFDTIRDVTSCVIITVPEDDELLKFLRNYRGNYMLELINLDGKYQRKVEFWKYGKDKLGRRRKRLKWVSSPFSIHVDNYYFGMYRKMKNIAKIQNKQRYEKKRNMKVAKEKYYETKQKYYQAKMDKEMEK